MPTYHFDFTVENLQPISAELFFEHITRFIKLLEKESGLDHAIGGGYFLEQENPPEEKRKVYVLLSDNTEYPLTWDIFEGVFPSEEDAKEYTKNELLKTHGKYNRFSESTEIVTVDFNDGIENNKFLGYWYYSKDFHGKAEKYFWYEYKILEVEI